MNSFPPNQSLQTQTQTTVTLAWITWTQLPMPPQTAWAAHTPVCHVPDAMAVMIKNHKIPTLMELIFWWERQAINKHIYKMLGDAESHLEK